MHIAITGNIGAGKTTLAEKLADNYGWEVCYEAVDGNPYLADFYKDMKKWAFHLQVFFLNSRFEQVLKIKKQGGKTIVQDRTIYEDAYIFAQNLADKGLLNETDFSTYKALFQTIMQAVSPPDLMVYLRADVPKLIQQIKKRGRDYEQSIDHNYLQSLNILYAEFSNRYNHGKLITIDVTELDFVESEADFRLITGQIEKQVNLGKQLKI